MIRSRMVLLAGLLALAGCGKKGEGDGGTGKPGAAALKDALLGKWMLVKSETGHKLDGKTGWEFKGGGAENKNEYKIKSVTDTMLVLSIDPTTDAKYMRKGGAAKGKTKAEKLVGRWQGPVEYNVFGKDGKWVYGTTNKIDGKSVDQPAMWGAYKLEGYKIIAVDKGEGFLEQYFDGYSSRSVWELKADKLRVSDNPEGTVYTLSLDGDGQLVATDKDGKKNVYKKEGGGSGGSKQDLLAGTWEVVKSEVGLSAGTTVAFTKDGKYTAELGGIKLNGTYKLKGDTLKQLADGSKIEVVKTIKTLTATSLVTEDSLKKVDAMKKK